VDAGETIALVGPSGGGKTTFLRCLNGLDSFDAGEIHVAGLDLAPRTPPGAPALFPLRARVGMVFQGFHLFPHLSVLENLCLAPLHVRREPPAEVRARAQSLLAKVGLGDRGNARPAQLSGGQQQRVAIARALTMQPEVLLLDEPTSALDPEMRGEVLSVLRDLSGTCTLLVVTHEMSFARGVATRIWVFDEGERGRAFFPTLR
jgi:ABC-type polar amino acid transport system ATPase subunit